MPKKSNRKISIGELIESQEVDHKRPKRRKWSWSIPTVIGITLCALIGQAIGVLPSSFNLRSTEQHQTSVAFALGVRMTASAPPLLFTRTPIPTAFLSATPLSPTVTHTPTLPAINSLLPTNPINTLVTMPPANNTIEIIQETSGTIYTLGRANLRKCPRTDCEIQITLGAGIALTYDATIEGEAVRDSNAIWYRVFYEERIIYVYSDVVTKVVPQPNAPITNFQPIAPIISTPAQMMNEWSCLGDIYDCKDFAGRCAELRRYWEACPGDPSKLDQNNDGRPCESTC